MKHFKFKIYAKIIILQIIVIFLMSQLVPLLLNYPPNSEEAVFQSQIEPFSHTMQYLSLGSLYIFLYIIMIKILFRDIFKYIKKDKKSLSFEEINKIRSKCLNMHFKLTLTQVVLLIFILLVLFFSLNAQVDLCFKFLLVYFSFFMVVIIISNVLIRNDLNEVIKSTYQIYNDFTDIENPTKFYMSLLFNLLPFFLVIIITITLLGYSRVCNSIGESNYYYYKIYLDNFNTNWNSVEDLKAELNNIPLKNSSDYYFIYTNSETVCSSESGKLSDFFIKYANTYLDQTSGRVYEYYGVAEEGYVKQLTFANGETGYFGFKYTTTNLELSMFFISITIIAMAIYTIIIYIWCKNISRNVSEIAQNLSDIAKKRNLIDTNNLPILSNDEIGELTVAFNNIKTITRENIAKLHENQDMLIEKERFASLGQMIGGIAHNLKTPIMSISGATEGLKDLIKEYEISVGDSDVTVEDHHEIANDMKTWIDKIKNYTEYMSDIITAVKGQAVTSSGDIKEYFTVGELIKQVDILMKHELKNSLTQLNITLNVDNELKLYGNINSLVQVLNNMVSNSIQSYNGKPNQSVELVVSQDNNNIVFSVIDYGMGMSSEVQNKLFKEMITTKGKNGTGLGLFMSYSNIKAHFNGNITFESEQGKGTVFNITIPLNQ